ncbi:MAG: fumarylacetoacetate hydrolase family protein [Gammaproteobacteria bacterium]|nr:fumarylacetoacetate hydrolase family protein [Gammaproteobacteria bacterium]MBT8110102.1 fumarylacetoacetate hydrolase family protein [Gammaproteobacteria bacterium]NNL44806.1 fumarylacetoacetate hydrolase family protein [Woeseiaceae bacterium]
MQLVSFKRDGELSYGLMDGVRVREASAEFRERFGDLRAVIAARAEPELADDTRGAAYSASDLRFVPVIPNPDKILCVGVNYRPHIEEMGRQAPDHPVVFVRFPASLSGHNEPILRPRASKQFDFEGELAIVIGKRARHVDRDDALDYIAGYCCFMDGSIRDWQRHTPQFTPGKNFHRSGAMGPCIVTADEIPDPSALQLTTLVNGEEMQRGRVADLVFDIPALIEYCSTFSELLPGDIIATGTPGGVGAARTPPVWLQAGDTVEVEIPGVGRLRSPVLDELTEVTA